MAAFDRIKPGDVLWESKKNPWRGWENWPLEVISVDRENRTAMCRWNHNEPRVYSARSLKRYRRTPKKEMVMSKKIYVASSWRNPHQQGIVQALRRLGHEVYDFKNPKPGDFGFSWKQVSDVPPAEWTPEHYLKALRHPNARAGFQNDFEAMQWADTFVLVLPCGRSAHLELGWAIGVGKRCFVLLQEKIDEPELMYLLGAKLLTNVEQLREELAGAASE